MRTHCKLKSPSRALNGFRIKLSKAALLLLFMFYLFYTSRFQVLASFVFTEIPS